MAKQIKGAEIFSIGTWNGLTFTGEDIDTMVSSFDALGLAGRVPLKLSHDGPDERFDPLTKLSMGWVHKVWREGSRLMADMEVPDAVAKLVKEGFLKFVSIELLRDVQASTRIIPWVLDAVALLGSEQPALGILRDLTSMDMSRRTAFQFRERASFRREITFEGDRKHMADDIDKSAQERIALLEKQLDESRAKAAERDVFERRANELDARIKNEKVTAHRAKIKEKFDSAVTEKRIQPKIRERFYNRFEIESDEVLKIDLATVDEYINENPNPLAPRLNTFGNTGDTVSVGATADAEALVKAREYIRANGGNVHDPQALVKAGIALFQRDKNLAERYRNLPADFAAGSLDR